MKGDLFDRTAKTVENIGFKKGYKDGGRNKERKFIRDLLDNDFELDDISRIFGLEKNYILSLLK